MGVTKGKTQWRSQQLLTMRPPIYLPDPDLPDLRISPAIVLLLLFVLAIASAFVPFLLALGIIAEVGCLLSPSFKKWLETNDNPKTKD